MSFEDEFLDFSESMINDFGASIAITKISNSEYNPSTGTVSKNEVIRNIKGVVESYARFYVENKQVESDDLKVVIAAKNLSFIPNSGDKLSYNSEEYNIVKVTSEQIGSQPIIYNLQIRK